MNTDNHIMCGLTGTVLGAAGAGLSVTEIQAIVSIIVTGLSFVFGVLVPFICKIVKKVADARKDGKVTADELKDIADTVDKGAKDVVDQLNQDK